MSGIPSWLARWRVTGTWDAHRARGSLGGVDFGAPVGTPIYAPTAGRVDYRVLSDGSSVARVRRPDGSATEFLHGRPSGSARAIAAGALIATSDGRRGVWGAGASTGPHIHVHDVTARGVRVYPFSTISTSPAGGGNSSPIDTTKEDDTMPQLFHKLGTTPTLFALAGASPGTSANWLETTDYNGLAVPFAERYGNSIPLSAGTWDAWKARYLEPLKVGGLEIAGGVTLDLAPLLAALQGLPDAILDAQAGRLKD